uniref:Uncharacterized protein n=1 Tax=Oryctolagus cuniculus TaxID=9986 RepID=A0A5F9C8F7_RABIT
MHIMKSLFMDFNFVHKKSHLIPFFHEFLKYLLYVCVHECLLINTPKCSEATCGLVPVESLKLVCGIHIFLIRVCLIFHKGSSVQGMSSLWNMRGVIMDMSGHDCASKYLYLQKQVADCMCPRSLQVTDPPSNKMQSGRYGKETICLYRSHLCSSSTVRAYQTSKSRVTMSPGFSSQWNSSQPAWNTYSFPRASLHYQSHASYTYCTGHPADSWVMEDLKVNHVFIS